MIRRFESKEPKLIQARRAESGDILSLVKDGRTDDLWLRLADDQPGSVLILTGKHKFLVWTPPSNPPNKALLVANWANLHLEIDDTKHTAGGADGIGNLRITENGAYIVANINTNQGGDDCWVSLSTWEVVNYQDVAGDKISFTTWRLVDSSNPSEKTVVLAFGDWE